MKYREDTGLELIVFNAGKSLTNVKKLNLCTRLKPALSIFSVRKQEVWLTIYLFKVFEFYLFKINITSSIGSLLF